MNNKKINITIWLVQQSKIKEDLALLNLDFSQLKAPHSFIIWKSWSGKSYYLSALVFWILKKAIIETFGSNDWSGKLLMPILDPHNSYLPLVDKILKEFLDFNPKYSRVFTNVVYSKFWPENNKAFDGYKISKKLIFNPLLCPDLKLDLKLLSKHTNYVLSSLQWAFDWSAFGPRNTLLLEAIIKAFLLFNREAIIKGEGRVYTMKDLLLFFMELQRAKQIPNYVSNSLSQLLKSGDKQIIQEANSIADQFNYIRSSMVRDSSFCDSAITKLKDFIPLDETFWGWCLVEDYTLDVVKMMNSKLVDTTCLMFNLEDFSQTEKTILISFLINAWYSYWSLKNHSNPSLHGHVFVVDELQSFLNIKQKWQKTPLIDTLERIGNELRKYKVSQIFALQQQTSELKDLLNNAWFWAVFALPSVQADFFTQTLTNWSGQEITTKDIENLARWQFYFIADTINNGVQVVISMSIDVWNEKDRKILY